MSAKPEHEAKLINKDLSLDEVMNACRLCLQYDGIMCNIFSKTKMKCKEPLNERIHTFVHVKILENDGLPANICHRCLFQTDMFTEFRDNCIENDNKLRKLVSTSTPAEGNLSLEVELEKYSLKHGNLDGDDCNTNNFDNGLCALVKNHHNQYINIIKGESEFYPDENSLVMIVDPTKEYSSADESTEKQSDTEMENRFVTMPQIDNSDMLKNVFMCQYCDAAYTLPESCTEHELKAHDPYDPYFCNFCSFKCDFRNNLILHIKEAHCTDKPFICVQCLKGFGRRSDLKKHTIVHTGVRPFTCPVCSKRFSRNTNLTKHLRIHSGQRPHVCSTCPRSFTRKADLFRHQQVHTEIKPFSCNTCGASFTRRDKLQNHEKIHFPKNNDILHKNKQNSEPITENMVISLNPFTGMDQINADEDCHHGDQNGFSVPDHIQNLELSFPVHVTGDLVTYRDLEQRHPNHNKLQLSAVHQQLQQSKPSQSNINNFKSKNFPCDKCPKHFATYMSLQNHQNIHLGVRNHLCTICNKAFFRKRELDRHSVIHTGFKPFECNTCHKKFGRKDKLVRHERIHSEDRLFPCTECKASFSRKDGLALHMKTHNQTTNRLASINSAILPAPVYPIEHINHTSSTMNILKNDYLLKMNTDLFEENINNEDDSINLPEKLLQDEKIVSNKDLLQSPVHVGLVEINLPNNQMHEICEGSINNSVQIKTEPNDK